MRFVTVLVLMAVAVAGLCQPAFPKEKKDREDIFANLPKTPAQESNVVVIEGSKRFYGYTTDSGGIYIENSHGKVIMNGWINRTNAVSLYSTLSEDNYVGMVNPMGSGLLMSPKTYETIRIEVQR